jgi:enoyl-CoA hydratase
MNLTTLLLEPVGSTLVITINRPEVLNALAPQVIEDLDAAIGHFLATPAYKGAILTGSGSKSFVAGADIAQIRNIPAEQTESFARRGQAVFARIEASPKPIIAAVNGFALGGGCELAMACHMRIASENAKFGQPEVNLGLIAGYGGTQRLPRLIGLGKATELLLSAKMVTAPEALQLGLVNDVAPLAELLDRCHALLNLIYEKSPLAVALTLQAIYAGVYEPATGYDAEAKAFGQAAASDDCKEGTRAFLEKRKAVFG